MMIVSHDRELLGLVDQIADLSGGKVRMYGGNLAAYELMAVERESAQRAAASAGAEVRGNGGTSSTLRSSRLPETDRAGRSPPHAACPGPSPMLAEACEESAGRSRELRTERLAAARSRLEEARQAARDDAEIRVELPPRPFRRADVLT